MHLILSAIIVLLAIIDMVIEIGFLVNPSTAAMDFGVSADGPMGLSALRADFTAFFVVSAVFMIWGAWRRRGDLLLFPLAMFLVAFTGRLVNLVVVGSYDGWFIPMTVEMVHVIVLALAMKAWPWARVAG